MNKPTASRELQQEVDADFDSFQESVTQWIEELRWPDEPQCPHCGSFNDQCKIRHKSQTHQCLDWPNKPPFTVQASAIKRRSHLTHREWAIDLHPYTTNFKGVSSMHLHRELAIKRKAEWFLPHRLRIPAETGEECSQVLSKPTDPTSAACAGT